ncbi:MAG TPA: hypothetical protein VK173_02665 [Lacibacter sp.]|nr:hypothetical protein [Lacibacter sp.]
MNLYYISSQKFSGNAEVLYDADGRLIRIDMSKTNMDVNQVHHFKARVSPAESMLDEYFVGTQVTIVQGTYEVPFLDFWLAYNKKINKARCIALWEKMSAADKVAALQGIRAYDAFLLTQPGRKKLDPENYLRYRAWENEYQ